MSLLPPVLSAPRPQTMPVKAPSHGDRWLDHLSLVPSQHLLRHGPAKPVSRLVQALKAEACAITWREALTLDLDAGPTGCSTTRQIIQAESEGWLNIHVRQPCPVLRVADFLVRSGLLMHWQVAQVFEGLPADEPCNLWRLSRDLVERRWFDGRHVGFLHRLGQLTHWQVGAIPSGTLRTRVTAPL